MRNDDFKLDDELFCTGVAGFRQIGLPIGLLHMQLIIPHSSFVLSSFPYVA
jgi:hypothetical protein